MQIICISALYTEYIYTFIYSFNIYIYYKDLVLLKAFYLILNRLCFMH